ncbi:hypothetical protein BB561_005467 [Smittium simulii]|uniref:Myb-like domain-containing protein n=1 Tax=Smittium simulii TaxID=133385 RepID=A0A2T9YA99_9FUNG|nr:hypothetical protein BB561_005467 [Smittium simulii]
MSIVKPRSMPTGARNVVRANDSASLWNCTLSPGWTNDEVAVLRQALIKFGIGNWAKIIESECLLGKTIAQMNLQTQRMLGQQSTAEFSGLHIDPFIIGELNSKKVGPNIKRKNGFIVNTEGKQSREDIIQRRKENRVYESTVEERNAIILKKCASLPPILSDKKRKLQDLKEELSNILLQIGECKKKIEICANISKQ